MLSLCHQHVTDRAPDSRPTDVVCIDDMLQLRQVTTVVIAVHAPASARTTIPAATVTTTADTNALIQLLRALTTTLPRFRNPNTARTQGIQTPYLALRAITQTDTATRSTTTKTVVRSVVHIPE